MTNVFLGRQPLLDRQLRTIGYELLFRSDAVATDARVADGDTATARVISHALIDIGLNNVVGDRLAFVNLTARYLRDDALLDLLPADRVVLEVLEDIEPTDEIVDALGRLRDRGFRIALDDFTPDGPTGPLRDLASIVKFDRRSLAAEELADEIRLDHDRGRLVVVEHIETDTERRVAADAGADYFQGFFFARPTTCTGTVLPVNAVAVVQLLAAVNRPDAEIDEIVDLLAQDVSMSLRTLRALNAASNGLRTEVESIRHAAVLLGRDRLRAIATVAMMASIESKPLELAALAMTRAKFCELVAERHRLGPPGTWFTAGMLSLVDVITDMPMVHVLDQIAVNDEIRTALLGGDGYLGDTLRTAVRLEQANAGGPDHDLLELHLRAVEWATRISGALGA